MNYDVFNGDADGLCALHQLRLAAPAESVLVTGVKRDIRLLDGVDAGPGDQVTVLDVALSENRAALERLLAAGARLDWFDHHVSENIPQHPGLHAVLDASPRVCTSLLVDRHLAGRHRAWAVVAAYGDNLEEAARDAGKPLHLTEAQLAELKSLGECLNYNAYGETVDDLHFHPAELYRCLEPHADPFSFIREAAAFGELRQGFQEDLALAAAVSPREERGTGRIYLLPEEPWSRRVSGAFINRVAAGDPQRAHAVLYRLQGGAYRVSVRAPLARPVGAHALCRCFATGGGREAAAGVTELAPSLLDEFVRAFWAHFEQDPAAGQRP